MVYQENVSLIPVVAVPTIIEQDDEGVSERDPSFLLEFADISLRVAKKGDRRIALQLVNSLTNTVFVINNFKPYFERPVACEDFTTRYTRRLKNDEGFYKVLVRGGIAKKDDSENLYIMNFTEWLQN